MRSSVAWYSKPSSDVVSVPGGCPIDVGCAYGVGESVEFAKVVNCLVGEFEGVGRGKQKKYCCKFVH